MYAIIKDRNRQIRVEEGESVLLDRLAGAEAGSELVIEEVCFVGGETPRIGTPLVEGAKVRLRIEGEVAGRKIVVGKFKRRKNYRRKAGFRPRYTKATVVAVEV